LERNRKQALSHFVVAGFFIKAEIMYQLNRFGLYAVTAEKKKYNINFLLSTHRRTI